MAIGRKLRSIRDDEDRRGVLARRARRTALAEVAADPMARASGAGVTGDPVRSYGRNLDGTPESRANRARLAGLQNTNAALGNEQMRLGNRAQEARVAAMTPDANGILPAQRGQMLGDVLASLTPDQQRPGFNQLGRVLAGGQDVTGRKLEGGNMAGDGRDYWLQSVQAQNPEAAREIFEQERQALGRGGGVAMTEDGRVIRADNNYQYDVQQDIQDPALRRMVPQMAEQNNTAQQKGLLAQVMQLGAQGVEIPDDVDLDNLSVKDVAKIQNRAAKTQAQKEYQANYAKLAGLYAKLKTQAGVEKISGEPIMRDPTPDEINDRVLSVLGPAPGQGDDVDSVLDEVAGAGPSGGPAMMSARSAPSPQSPPAERPEGAAPSPPPNLATVYGNPAAAPTVTRPQPRDILGGPNPADWDVKIGGDMKPFVVVDGQRVFLTPEEVALYRRQKAPRQVAWKNLLENAPRYEGSAAEFGS